MERLSGRELEKDKSLKKVHKTKDTFESRFLSYNATMNGREIVNRRRGNPAKPLLAIKVYGVWPYGRRPCTTHVYLERETEVKLKAVLWFLRTGDGGRSTRSMRNRIKQGVKRRLLSNPCFNIIGRSHC